MNWENEKEKTHGNTVCSNFSNALKIMQVSSNFLIIKLKNKKTKHSLYRNHLPDWKAFMIW